MWSIILNLQYTAI